MNLLQDKIFSAYKAAVSAGLEILKIYTSDFTIQYKDDSSPLTAADTAGQKIIREILQKGFPQIPFLGEESKTVPYAERKKWNQFWLVDPLDGTKEFIKRNGEFTVNIALIRNREPVCGVVYIPVTDTVYLGLDGKGAFKIPGAARYNPVSFKEVVAGKQKLPAPTGKRSLTIITSRSHLNEATEKYVQTVKKEYGDVTLINSGSSIKLCLVAEGCADLYPRFAPTMEWDTAAGHAVCRAAGCKVINWETKQPLVYNKENLLNPWFLVTNRK